MANAAPKALPAGNQTDAQLRETAPCFSKMWDHEDLVCMRDCAFERRCVKALVSKTFPDILQAYEGAEDQPEQTPDQLLATELAMSPENIKAARARAATPEERKVPEQDHNFDAEEAQALMEADGAEDEEKQTHWDRKYGKQRVIDVSATVSTTQPTGVVAKFVQRPEQDRRFEITKSILASAVKGEKDYTIKLRDLQQLLPADSEKTITLAMKELVTLLGG